MWIHCEMCAWHDKNIQSTWNPLVPPWLLDQTSIICFKQCPYLISFMLDICTEVLRTAYQHNRPKLSPFLFIRRVTPVYLRTLSKLPWNLQVWKYVRHCFESHHQKGFVPGMSGTFEHIAEMSHIINHSKNINGV